PGGFLRGQHQVDQLSPVRRDGLSVGHARCPHFRTIRAGIRGRPPAIPMESISILVDVRRGEGPIGLERPLWAGFYAPDETRKPVRASRIVDSDSGILRPYSGYTPSTSAPVLSKERQVQTLLSEPMVRELNARFETSDPTDILRWALLDSGLPRVGIASAFQAEGTAVIHMAVGIRPEVPILFLETGF